MRFGISLAKSMWVFIFSSAMAFWYNGVHPNQSSQFTTTLNYAQTYKIPATRIYYTMHSVKKEKKENETILRLIFYCVDTYTHSCIHSRFLVCCVYVWIEMIAASQTED